MILGDERVDDIGRAVAIRVRRLDVKRRGVVFFLVGVGRGGHFADVVVEEVEG
jgi:hypothetical protein